METTEDLDGASMFRCLLTSPQPANLSICVRIKRFNALTC
jgi:hypothetical protein